MTLPSWDQIWMWMLHLQFSMLRRCFRSACTLKLLLPLLPVRSNTPSLPCAPFLQHPLRVSSPSSPCPLPPTAIVFIHSLSSGLISVSIHCSKSQSGGGVCKKYNCYKKKIMQDVIWHKHQFFTILLMRRWRSVVSNVKLEHIQYLYLYVSSSSDLDTLQGSPQKYMDWNTTRQRQWVEGISGHPTITTIQPISF